VVVIIGGDRVGKKSAELGPLGLAGLRRVNVKMGGKKNQKLTGKGIKKRSQWGGLSGTAETLTRRGGGA